MAVPLQYQSQYIPTNFQAIGQLTNMLAQDMSSRDAAFDRESANINQQLANIYGQETYDPELFQQAGDALSAKIDEAIKAKNGDYVEASKDIARLIANEASNPIYNLNKRKLEQSKLLERSLANNPNLWVLNDPRQMQLNAGMNPEDISYSVLDPEEIRKRAKEDLAYLDNKRLAGIRTTPEGYDVASYSQGPSDMDVSRVMQDEELRNKLRSYFPQLSEGQFDNELTNIIGAAAKSYQKSPVESVMRFNPYLQQKLNNSNPYAAITPLTSVGTKGLENTFSVKKPEDIYSLPDDNSRLGLIKKNLMEDVIYGSKGDTPSFYDKNKETFDEIGGIDNARQIISEYEAIDESVEEMRATGASRLTRGTMQLINPSVSRIPESSIPRETYSKAKALVNNFEEKLSERLFEENSDMMKDFKYFDTFTGVDKLDTRTEKFSNRLDKMVKDGVIPITELEFEGSDNKDITFAGKDAKELLGDNDWINASEGNMKITGLAMDPIYGMKLMISTDNEDGGTTRHIAHPRNQGVEETIMRAFGYTGNVENLPPDDPRKIYQFYRGAKMGEQLLSPQGIQMYPDLNIEPGTTVGDYREQVKSLVNSGQVPKTVGTSVLQYLMSLQLADNVTF